MPPAEPYPRRRGLLESSGSERSRDLAQADRQIELLKQNDRLLLMLHELINVSRETNRLLAELYMAQTGRPVSPAPPFPPFQP